MPDNTSKFDAEAFAAAANVSRETLARLKAYAGLLADWNRLHNLVSARSLEDAWRRHFWDSAQLLPFIPECARTLADLGSGAGFPGLILGELLRGRVRVTLFEATAKKCAFLAAAAVRMDLEVDIRNKRMESAAPEPFDVVTARACAPLPALLSYAQQFVAPGGLCLFLKGQNLGPELTEARKSWNMEAVESPSLSDPSGVVLAIRELSRHAPKTQNSRRRQPKGRGR